MIVGPVLAAVALVSAGIAGARVRWADTIRRAGVRKGDGPRPPRAVYAGRFAHLASPVGALIAGWSMFGPIGGLGSMGAVLLWRVVAGRRSRSRLISLRDEQLVDAVTGLSAALRAGLSVEQALRFVAAEASAPLKDALADLVRSLDLGLPLTDALDAWAAGEASADPRLVAGVLRLHRRSGGDLPTVLDQVGATLRERRAAAQEVRALTAQARLSGLILGLLPVGFFAFLFVTSRADIQAAFHSPVGVASVLVGLALESAAFLWIRHLLEVA